MSVSAHDPAKVPGRLAYSVEEAAELLGVGRTFMFQLVATGEVDSFKIGSRRKIPRDAIDAYIEQLRAQQAPTATRRSGLRTPSRKAPPQR